MMADELSIYGERVWTIIIEDLEMKMICAKMVPRLLNDEQKECQLQECQDILKELETEADMLIRVVTSDEL